MNKDRIEGAAKEIKGKVKEGVGKATGNVKTEVKGKLEQAAGKVQNAYGKAKDDVEDQAKEQAKRTGYR